MNCINENWFRSNLILELCSLLGMSDVVISPGSRNTPLSHCAIHHPKLTSTVHIDERGAGFYALGIAKASKVPVGLICTSGTAAANYFPAIIEAYYSNVPLIIFTADRPRRLQNCGSPQTMDQNRLYGSYTPFFTTLSESICDIESAKHFLSRFVKEYALAYKHLPMHINCPFDEPLSPQVLYTTEQIDKRNQFVFGLKKQSPIFTANRSLSTSVLSSSIEFPNSGSFGIVLGPDSFRDEKEQQIICGLLETLQAPIYSDCLSGIHNCANQIAFADLVLHTNLMKDNPIEIVLWFGKQPTSRSLQRVLSKATNVIHCSTFEKMMDIDSNVNLHIHSSIDDIKILLSDIKISNATEKLLQVSKEFQNRIQSILNRDDIALPNEVRLLKLLSKSMMKFHSVFVGNSMVMRWVNMFFHPINQITYYGNKGVNGIDGNLATTAGIAKFHQRPMMLFIGDVSFLHDVNSLLLLKDLPVLMVVMNNNGGGIFHLLPEFNHFSDYDKQMKSAVNSFEMIQGTPQSFSARAISEGFGISYHSILPTFDKLQPILDEFHHGKKPMVLECNSNRYESFSQLHSFLQTIKDLRIQ